MIRISHLMLAASLTLTATSALAKDKAEHVFGPPPTWEQYRAIAEAGLKERLIDPDSARITWAGGYFKGNFKPLLSGRIDGYVGCGTVNSRNRMGGYAGATSFVTVVDYDRVLFVDLDRVAGGMIEAACRKSVASGLLSPLPASVGGGTPSPTDMNQAAVSVGASGMTLRAMPDGAYITAVAANSPAALADLKPGMVITSVNAIPLAGMGDAMSKIIEAAGSGATLVLAGGKTVKLASKS